MAHFYDAHWREAPLYTVGDKVWLNGEYHYNSSDEEARP